MDLSRASSGVIADRTTVPFGNRASIFFDRDEDYYYMYYICSSSMRKFKTCTIHRFTEKKSHSTYNQFFFFLHIFWILV